MTCAMPTVITNLPATLYQVASKIHEGYTFVGRKIEDITGKSFLGVAVQQVYWGLPTTIALAALPLPTHWPCHLIAGAAVVVAISILQLKKMLPDETLNTLYTGLRNFFIIEAIRIPIAGEPFWALYTSLAVDAALRIDTWRLELLR